MSRKVLRSFALMTLVLSTTGAEAADLCTTLRARLAQMPEIVGSGTAVHVKSESLFRLNRLEIAIRRDMRRLDCPTASVVYYGDEEAAECQQLGEELSQVRADKQSFQDLQPVLSQVVDDGTGLLPALIVRMQEAGCDLSGSQQDIEIIGSGASSGEAALHRVSADTGSFQQSRNDAGQSDDVSAIFGNEEETSFGATDSLSITKIAPEELPDGTGSQMAVVEPPKLEGEELLPAPGKTAGMKPSVLPAPDVAVRDYNPNDRSVRRIGPSFLAEKEDGINLGRPAATASAN